MAPTMLSKELSQQVCDQFDSLRSQRLLHYEPSEEEYVNDEGFQLQFRITTIWNRKPILAADDSRRRKGGGPFTNPEPEFVVSAVGASHLLQLNKFCMLRPSLILHPIVFEPQDDDLSDSDIEAAWSVLHSLDVPSIVFYNCGANAGASQGHKHMQIIPKPGAEFPLFPDIAEISSDEPVCLPGIPFAHWLIHLTTNATLREVIKKHRMVVEATEASLVERSIGIAYNILIVESWIIGIPRSSKGVTGLGVNAVGMMGLVWLGSEEERQAWTRMGLSKYLAEVGIPKQVNQ